MATNLTPTTDVLEVLSASPPSTCCSEKIDFASKGLNEYEDCFALLIHDLLSPAECEALIAAAQGTTGGRWDPALIAGRWGQQELATDVRLCDRILWDDKDVAQKIQDRIMPCLPADIVNLHRRPAITEDYSSDLQATWTMTRLNERLRFLRYTKGMYFRPHYDGFYATPDGNEVSFLTVHLYLNGPAKTVAQSEPNVLDEHLPLQGGATRFFGTNDADFLDINPTTGACLVFQHSDLIHSGQDVTQGTKYTMRTDIMYRKA